MSEAHNPEHRIRGIALRSGAVICFSIMIAALKVASDRGVSMLELMFYRNFFALPVVVLWLALGPGFSSVKTKRPGAHLSRAVIGLASMALNFKALTMLPLAEATTIGFAAPLFATILSAIVLGEAVGRHRWLAVVVGFAGVLVVMRPGGGPALPLDGLIVAIFSAVGVAAVVITLRQIGATEPASTTVFWFNVATLVTFGPALPFFARWHEPATWAILLLMGLSGGLSQILMTSSLRNAPVAVLAPFDYAQLIWATLLGWLIWAKAPSGTTLAGGLLIAASGIYTGYREHRRHRAALAAMSTPQAL